MNKIFVYDSDFIFSQLIEVIDGAVNAIHQRFGSQFLIKYNHEGIISWSIIDYENKIETTIEFNQPGNFQNFILKNSNIHAYKMQTSKVIMSSDLGKTFIVVPQLPASTIHDVKVFNSNLYIASDEYVFCTSDSGLNWDTIYTSIEEPLCIAMNSKNKLYIVSDKGKVYREIN